MWDGNLLHFDRFQTKKIITIMWEGNLLPFDRFQKKNYYAIMWQIPEKKLQLCERLPTYWQIPDKNNNYNYVRGQFTTFWQIPEKK